MKRCWPQTDEMEGSELADLECGSVQGGNKPARPAGSSYRFGNLSWEGYRVAPSARKTLNLPCRLPSRCGPLRSNPIFNLRGLVAKTSCCIFGAGVA